MKTYIGTKIIQATPMNRQAYNEYRGWTLPENEDGADEGYLVEYTDGGKGNDSRHAGYISWSPKAQFEQAYLEIGDVTGLPAYLQRVVAEAAALNDKGLKLHAFLVSPAFLKMDNEPEKQRLLRQYKAMTEYNDILQERIRAFLDAQKAGA